MDKCILKLSDNPNSAAIVTKNIVINDSEIDRTGIYCSNEKIFYYLFCVQSRIGFQLIPKLDEIILKLTESGILDKWMILQIYEMGLLNTNASLVTNVKINEKRTFDKLQGEMDELVSLSFAHIGGAFLIFFIGHGLALIVFVLEIFLHKYEKIRT